MGPPHTRGPTLVLSIAQKDRVRRTLTLSSHLSLPLFDYGGDEKESDGKVKNQSRE